MLFTIIEVTVSNFLLMPQNREKHADFMLPINSFNCRMPRALAQYM